MVNMTTISRESLHKLSGRPVSPKSQMEAEKRIRREIANSNERRRMQSINAGFQSLRTLLPHHDGEKLSKAAILQHTADYIYQLEQEKTRLLAQNCQLKRLVNNQMATESDVSNDNSPLHKRIKIEKSSIPMTVDSSDSSDEVVCRSPKSSSMVDNADLTNDDLKREMVELRLQLDRERRLRMSLEEQTRALETQLYPEKIREIAHNMQYKYQTKTLNSCQEISESELASDDVFSETVEIEAANSCPTSPCTESPRAFTAAITNTPTIKTIKTEPIQSDIQPQDLSAKSISCSPKKTSPQPAAIALPIDVPFITTDNVDSGVTLEIIDSTGTGYGSTSRQNLDTIVEAIRHLEGDHLFRDDDSKYKYDEQIPEEESKSSNATLSPSLRTVLTMSPEQFGAIRHQVIQLQRPNVIVANHA
ncbi:transcription factor AP-4-like isoform X2 [Oppia nitens]|uniref:transcription factor AP-4-like isoform X2 n=1 Tax=Oppia nitens TaxID=1686743 RepID=UPI0023DC4BBA|nr:transcription factor AP-4-like isoform X2 [Oppia nitens]